MMSEIRKSLIRGALVGFGVALFWSIQTRAIYGFLVSCGADRLFCDDSLAFKLTMAFFIFVLPAAISAAVFFAIDLVLRQAQKASAQLL